MTSSSVDLKTELIKIYGENSATPNYHGLLGLLLVLDLYDEEPGASSDSVFSPVFKTKGRKGMPALMKKLHRAHEQNDILKLKKHADVLIIEIGQWEQNPDYMHGIIRIYNEIEEQKSANDQQPKPSTSVGFGVANTNIWDSISPNTKEELFTTIKTIASNYQALACTSRDTSLVAKDAGGALSPIQTILNITTDCWQYLRQWYNEEISGRRCAKQCVESILGQGAGIAGALIGTAVYPGFGTAAGALVGAVVQGLTKRLTRLFNLPKTQAEEEAYSFLGIPHTASDAELWSVYREKARLFHPDKGGNVEDFFQLQHQMAVIKLAREKKDE